jgi:hypothetical protein
MKKITFKWAAPAFVAVSLCVLIASCKEETSEPVKFDAKASASTVDSGAVVIFTDNSTGVKTRTWTFPTGTPATSSEAMVNVNFMEGPVTAKLVDVFTDGTTKTKEFKLQIGTEMYSREIFGFEGDSAVAKGKGWKVWNAASTPDVKIEIDKTQGANGTTRCLKVTLTKALTNEAQIFTKENMEVINAVLEPNKPYTYSFWIKGDANLAGKDGFDCDVVNSNEASWGNGLPVQDWKDYAWWGWFPVGTEWTQMTVNINPSDNYSGQNAANAYAWFKIEAGLPAGVFYIDEVSIKPKL